MRQRSIFYLLALLVILSSCSSKAQKDRTISMSGAFALYPLAVRWSEEYRKLHPEIRFNISAGGAGKGMADAMSGTVDLGMVSREIEPEEKALGAWWIGLCIDAVIPTISAENPFLGQVMEGGIDREEFRAIFIEGTLQKWGGLDGIESPDHIEVYTRSDACGAAGTWADYLGGKQEDLKGVGIYGDPGLAEAVIRNPMGIAFNNTAFIYDIQSGQKRPGIETVPIDINANGTVDPEENFYDNFNQFLLAVAEDRYPSPPARELYFVANGKPVKRSTLDFIRWTLTEGQKHVAEAGYVPISESKINSYLEKLK